MTCLSFIPCINVYLVNTLSLFIMNNKNEVENPNLACIKCFRQSHFWQWLILLHIKCNSNGWLFNINFIEKGVEIFSMHLMYSELGYKQSLCDTILCHLYFGLHPFTEATHVRSRLTKSKVVITKNLVIYVIFTKRFRSFKEFPNFPNRQIWG